MAVRWRGQTGTGFGKPYRTDFGRILVTIDDLTTLQDLLARYNVEQVRPAIQFDDGEFDVADDLRILPGVRELTLEVESKNITVRLSEKEAYVVGAELVCLDLKTQWAKNLRTNALTSNLRRELWRMAWRMLVLISFCGVLPGSSNITWSGHLEHSSGRLDRCPSYLHRGVVDGKYRPY